MSCSVGSRSASWERSKSGGFNSSIVGRSPIGGTLGSSGYSYPRRQELLGLDAEQVMDEIHRKRLVCRVLDDLGSRAVHERARVALREREIDRALGRSSNTSRE